MQLPDDHIYRETHSCDRTVLSHRHDVRTRWACFDSCLALLGKNLKNKGIVVASSALQKHF